MSDRRSELKKEENRLLSEIEYQSTTLEHKAEKIVKNSLIVGASILVGYTIYSVLSSDSDKSKKNKKQKYVSSGVLNNPLIKNIFQSAIKKGVELLVKDKIKDK